MSGNDRLEREIEEILGKIEHFPGPESRAKRARRRILQRAGYAVADRVRAVARELSRISMSQVMLLAFLMILFSFVFRRANPLMMNWVLYAGIILFVSAFAILVFTRRGGGGGTVEQNWRGRTIRYQTGPTLSQRIRRWFGSRRARR